MARVRDAGRVYDSTKGARDHRDSPTVAPTDAPAPDAPTDSWAIVPYVPIDDPAPTEEIDDEEVEEKTEDFVVLDSDADADDDDSQPLPPEKMFFGPTEYTKGCKIGIRCGVTQTVEFIEKTFPAEVSWFRNHDQFKHIFHMPKELNHMTQGMWMLLLRTACTDMARECWFVVNRVPIRYSLKEHTLLTGFDRHEYPNEYEKLGGLKFVKRMFGRTERIKIKDVEEKLMGMKSRSSVNRKKMTILYFLCKVVKANSKGVGNIEPFLLSVVDDLNACEKFPWRRYSFEECMKRIRSMMKNLKGSVKPKAQSSFSGFIVPLEIMAFECIPHLGHKFRDDVPAEKDCPRMCKHKFTEPCMEGFTLEEINEALGKITDISSILELDSDEKSLLARIIDDDADDGIGFIDPVVDRWRERLTIHKKKIWWKYMYECDLDSRRIVVEVPETAKEVPENTAAIVASINSLKEAMKNGFAEMVEKFAAMNGRVKALEVYVAAQLQKEAKKEMHPGTPMDFQPSAFKPSDLQSMDLVIYSGACDPISPIVEDKSGEEEKNNKKEKKEKAKKDSAILIETGKKRTRQASRHLKTPYAVERKRQRENE